MPLVGLEDIKWGKLKHVYGTAENLPNLLRAVDEAQSYDDFEEAMRELWMYIYHQGDVSEATPLSLQFVLQILKNTDAIRRKMLILMGIGETLRNLNLADMAHERATYDTVANELDYFLFLLMGEILELRVASIFVLYFLIEQHERILPTLLDFAEKSEDVRLTASAIWAYSHIVKSQRPLSTETNLEQLIRWIENESQTLLVRYAAAFGYLSITLPRNVSAVLSKLIAQAFTTPNWEIKRGPNKELDYLYAELMPFPDIALLKSASSQFWIDILQVSKPSPIQAHQFVREIVNKTFARLSYNQWNSPDDWTNQSLLTLENAQLIYTPRNPHNRRYYAGNLDTNKRLALQTIVDCEPFWEIPTNLFSFFYGLPDDREELRKLAQGDRKP
jgi:hypothetical protein